MAKRLAIMTGGGDCAGLNAAIRAATRTAHIDFGWEVIGIEDGFEGLIQGRYRTLTENDLRGILPLGGTILGASNRTNPFRYAESPDAEPIDASERAHQTLRDIGADALIVIGGDGTLFLANRFAMGRIQLVCVPKTIDNDVHGTEYAIGFDSCVATVSDALDKVHTTAESHHRVLLVEVMGRTVGWIALYSAIAGGADIALIPERPFTIEGVVDIVQRRFEQGKLSTIAVVAEGITLPTGAQVYREQVGERHRWRFGGVGAHLQSMLEDACEQEVRTTVLGHLQRGGSPTAFDRVLASQFGRDAVHAIAGGAANMMVGAAGRSTHLVPLEEVAKGPRAIPQDHPLLQLAESLGIYVG